MGKLAFVFPGQGAQFAGMGKCFYDRDDGARALFDAAEARRPGTLAQCFEGDAAVLKKTENTQPCLYLAALSAALALRNADVEPDAVAGFSLGELPALSFAGAFSQLDGFELACRRGIFMQAAAEARPAWMAAVLRLAHGQVEALCAGFREVYPVNYNCDGQVVVAMAEEARPTFKEAVAAAGGRFVPLAVGGGFHSPFMDSASEAFGRCLQSFEIVPPNMTAYSNYTSRPYGQQVRPLLEKQINHPVHWDDIVIDLTQNGFDTFVEVGAGNVLQKLIGRIAPQVRAFAVDSWQSFAEVKEYCHAEG